MGKMKLPAKAKLILLFLIIGGVIYGFYLYLYLPLVMDKDKLQTELTSLDSQLKDIDQLNVTLSNTKQNVKDKEKELEQMKEVRHYGSVRYKDFIKLLGDASAGDNIEVSYITPEEPKPFDSHKEIPYTLSVKGDYVEILYFVNEIYRLKTFQIISDIELKKVVLDDENLSGTISNSDWASQIKHEIQSVVTSPTVSEEANEETNEKESQVETPKTLQLDFELTFISIDESDQNTPLEFRG